MQQARGLALLAPHANTMPTPLPVSFLTLPHLSRLPMSLYQQQPSQWNGRVPSLLPLLGSVPVTALPLKHSCPDVAVAVRLLQMTGQNSHVTSAELLENWTLPRTPGTAIRKQNISLALVACTVPAMDRPARVHSHGNITHWQIHGYYRSLLTDFFIPYIINTLKKYFYWVETKTMERFLNKKV